MDAIGDFEAAIDEVQELATAARAMADPHVIPPIIALLERSADADDFGLFETLAATFEQFPPSTDVLGVSLQARLAKSVATRPCGKVTQKFILMVRDPRACAAALRSALELDGLDGNTRGWLSKKLASCEADIEDDLPEFLAEADSGEELLGLINGSDWSETPELAAEALLQLLGPDVRSRKLAYAHYAMTSLREGVLPDRAAFFEAAGRPISGIPKMDWKPIPAGTFAMGSEDGHDDDTAPVHEVELAAFEMAATPVTRRQFRGLDPNGVAAGRDLNPITNVDWYEARLFCEWVAGRIPTEAEWEYACRGGTTTTYWSGDSVVEASMVGWPHEGLRDVGTKPANAFGLHDVHGHVREWCADVYDGEYYADSPRLNPTGPVELDDYRVARNASSVSTARSAHRGCQEAYDPEVDLGFRPARGPLD
ncbi:MAG: sulfatase activating formylglycine-generating enzyme [Myxococcota bacterium]|jgi:formylglycine-generating enzyme required for sulfatase activity